MLKEINNHNLYLKCNVLLLADIFEKFRYNSLRNYYRICSSHYFEHIILSWDAMLNIRKLNLSLVQVLACICSLKKGIRGRVSHISKWYSRGNNKYLKSYDPKQESKYIIYLDVNNLYGAVHLLHYHKMTKTWIPSSPFPHLFDFGNPSPANVQKFTSTHAYDTPHPPPPPLPPLPPPLTLTKIINCIIFI